MPNRNRCGVCHGLWSKPKGCTYIVQRERWVKIGRSGNPTQRIRHLQGRVPGVLHPVDMDWSAPLDTVAIIREDWEHTLHEQFADEHVIGEWFEATPRLIAAVKAMAA